MRARVKSQVESELVPFALARTASILLVDDHPPNLTALEAILEPLGERLVRASSGAEAVARARDEDFALVLVDLQMPELDGLETAACLKKMARARSLPIIILTASEPTRAVVAKGYASGAVDFLSKPLDPDVVRSKVTVFVELHKQRLALRPSEARLATDDASGRVSERLLPAAPASDRAAEVVEALVRIHDALTSDLDARAIAQRLADETCTLRSATGAAFHYATPDGFEVAASGEAADELTAMGPSSPWLRALLADREPVRIDELRAVAHELGLAAPGRLRSVLAVPAVGAAGHLAGALVLSSDRPSAFDERDEELVRVAARHAAVALDKAHLYAQAREARDRAEVAELELRANEARLRLALDSAGIGTWDFNPRTQTLRWDARARTLHGCGEGAELALSAFLARVSTDDRERMRGALAAAVEPSGCGELDEEYRVTGGAERWVHARGQCIFEHGAAVRFIGTVLDATARKLEDRERAALLARERDARAEAELARGRAEHANRVKDEFLATVSHELRNPLNAIVGWARVLLDEHDSIGEARFRKGLEVIARNARAQVQLVEDILEVSRFVTGKIRLQTDVVDVRAVVDSALDTVRAAAQARGVLLESVYEADPLTVVADEDRVQQILWNLLSNAVKFTPRSGIVRVAVRREVEHLVISVSDTGEGISADFLPHVFDLFRQADGSTTRAHGGLGLGLAIVRQLAELHGGTVEARSDGKGNGATFTVRLPIASLAEAEPEEPSRRAPRRAAGRPSSSARLLDGQRILVVDDDEDMRELIGMVLEHAGARVIRAGSVAEASNVVESSRFDVVLSDLAMPGEDGYELVRRLRASARAETQRVPVIAMTAYARAEDRHRVLSAGFQRHVPKPVEPAQLVDAVLAVMAAQASGSS